MTESEEHVGIGVVQDKRLWNFLLDRKRSSSLFDYYFETPERSVQAAARIKRWNAPREGC